MIAKEAAQHKDILFESVVDSYRNLTIKALLTIKYFTKYGDR